MYKEMEDEYEILKKDYEQKEIKSKEYNNNIFENNKKKSEIDQTIEETQMNCLIMKDKISQIDNIINNYKNKIENKLNIINEVLLIE